MTFIKRLRKTEGRLAEAFKIIFTREWILDHIGEEFTPEEIIKPFNTTDILDAIDNDDIIDYINENLKEV